MVRPTRSGNCQGRNTFVEYLTTWPVVRFLPGLRILLPLLLALAGCPAPDYDPPEVTLLSPAAGDTVGLEVAVRATVEDQSRIVVADFYAGGRLIGTDSSGRGDTFEISWSTADFAPGAAETLRCAARDAADNVGRSAPVVVIIGAGAGTHHYGAVSAPETWLAADNPHIIDRDLFVEAVLRLGPGVQVLVADGAAIRVGTQSPGGLWAVGKGDSAITITALAPNPAVGSWSGIEFRRRALAESCRLRNCVVEYGGGNGIGLVWAESCAVSIVDSRLASSSSVAVVLSGCGFAEFTGNRVEDCVGLPVRVGARWAGSLGAGNVFNGNGRNGIEIPGGTVSSSDTWPAAGAPFCITADVEVADSSNPLLWIAEGCSLLFADSAGMRIGDSQRPGGLRCDGTFGTVVFSRLGSGNWRGIDFRERADTLNSALRFCRMEYSARPAVTCYSAPVAMTGCEVSGCTGSGIVLRGCGFRSFTGNTISGCGGYGLEVDAPYVGSIGTGNSLAGNVLGGVKVAGGSVTRSGLWHRLDAPYVVSGVVEVGSDVVPQLVFEAGVTVRFEAGAGLAVGRSAPAVLRAVSTGDSITFRGVADSAGAWGGITLGRFAQNSSRLERCRLLYGGAGGLGLLYVDSCVPVVTGCEIGWSSNYCVVLNNTLFDVDSLRANNWLHDWNPDFDDILDEGR